MNENPIPSATAPVSPMNYRPRFTLYHANSKGTGSALKLSLLPAMGDLDGCVMLQLSNQKTIGDRRGENPVYATFDWENSLTVKLDFNDLCQFLQVFRGETESINDDKGLFHLASGNSTKIQLRHLVETVPGYMLELYRNPAGGGETLAARFFVKSAEATGLTLALEHAIGPICFGLPRTYAGDEEAVAAASARRRGNRNRERDAHAA